MQPKQRIVALTGAGISAESGIATFRYENGLWENYEIEDVATPSGLANNRKLVIDFYNELRRRLCNVEPNSAHYALSKLEDVYDVTIITQNIDDLHERAGSSKVLHLHGELTKARDEHGNIIRLVDDIPVESTLRPHVVFFTEMLYNLDEAIQAAQLADLFIVIGTSLQVYPAASLPCEVRPGTRVIVINPDDAPFEENGTEMWDLIKAPATEGMNELLKTLMKSH